MKKLSTLLWAVVALLGVSAWSSCSSDDDDSDGWDVDWAPAEILISVKDMYGNDLLDTLSNSCVVDVMTATFKGETYQIRKNFPEYTRVYLAQWHGFCLVDHEFVWTGKSWECKQADNFMIYVGEIDGAVDMDEDIVLSFPRGVTHTIHYHCSDHVEKRGKMSCNRYYMLDGKRLDSNKIEIVL